MWKPRNVQVAGAESDFLYYGTCNSKGTQVLVYGDKPEPTEEVKKPREPQSRRTLNESTITQMVRGKCGYGTPGVDSLAPLGNGRDHVEIECFGDEDSPLREDYLAACETVLNEMGEDAPQWLRQAVEVTSQ